MSGFIPHLFTKETNKNKIKNAEYKKKHLKYVSLLITVPNGYRSIAQVLIFDSPIT